MYLFINGTNRTENLITNSIDISDELQERANTCSFQLAGLNPSYFDDVKVYEGFPILSSASTSITLNLPYARCIQNNLFRVNDVVTVAIGLGDEENGTVLTVENNGGNTKLTFATFTNTPAAGELAGRKKFAGNIFDVQDKNNTVLTNIEFDVTAIDYTRIFDRKLINDTYESRDARYMINDFCNVTVNKNQTIDQFDYANTTALRAAWTESGDGGNPTLDTSDFRETDGSGVFDWTFSGGTATFTNAITAVNISDLAGATSGSPTKGRLGFWYKCADYTDVTSIKIRLGSDSSNYVEFTATPTDNDWTFFDQLFTAGSKTGTPVWTAVDYVALIITETGTSSVRIDGIRVLENSFFRHWPYIGDTIVFDDFKIGRVKPTEVMQRIADNIAWYWYVDYDKYIHLFPNTNVSAPISLSETSDNFANLQITYDISRLVNRQIVEGADETSDTTYSQVIEGDGIVREWIMKNKFKNLVVKLDDNTSTDLTEASTTTTTINATAHGLVADDYIVNRTRSNAVRKVLTVPSVDQFTVEAVTGQTSGDTFSKFVAKNVGVEGIDDETLYDYMSNFNQKSIRNTETEPTVGSAEFLLFQYNEIIPILVQRTNWVSVESMRTLLGYTDGIIDGQRIIDRTLTSRTETMKTADAVLQKYSNVIITANFTTNQEGLETGQLIRITDTTSSERNINKDFLIQSIKMRQMAWGENRYTVKCSSLLFGMLELLQQLLANGRKIKVDEDQVVNNLEDVIDTMIVTDVGVADVDGELTEEIMIVADAEVTEVIEPPFQWGPGGSPQLKWNLGSWG